jgi:hypothetical protein
MASYSWPGTSNASVGTNGQPAPLFSTEIGGINTVTGFLNPYSATAPGVEGAVLMTVQGATSGVPLNTNVAQWGGVATTLGQKAMAASVPVVIASDQSDVPVNLHKIGGAAYVLGQAVMASSAPVVIASNQTPIPVTPAALSVFDVNLTEVGGSAVALGQTTMSASIPMVIASDQTAVPVSGTVTANQGTANATPWNENIAQYGGANTSLGQKAMASSIPVALASDQSAIPTTSTTGGNVPLQFVRNVYSSTNVTTAAYVQLIASTSGTTNNLFIFDSSGQTMALAFGGSGSEVQQFLIPPGGLGPMPIKIPSGTRVSIIAISANATAGEIDLNLFT